MINELAKEIHRNSKEKSFYDKEKNIGEMLCLIHGEVSEALEADRENHYCEINNISLSGLANKNYGASFHNDEMAKEYFERYVKNTFQDELADIMIRVMDLAAYKGIDLEKHIQAKIRYNSFREKKTR